MDVAMSMGIYGDGAWAGGRTRVGNGECRWARGKGQQGQAWGCEAWCMDSMALTVSPLTSCHRVWCTSNQMRDWSGTVKVQDQTKRVWLGVKYLGWNLKYSVQIKVPVVKLGNNKHPACTLYHSAIGNWQPDESRLTSHHTPTPRPLPYPLPLPPAPTPWSWVLLWLIPVATRLSHVPISFLPFCIRFTSLCPTSLPPYHTKLLQLQLHYWEVWVCKCVIIIGQSVSVTVLELFVLSVFILNFHPYIFNI